MTAWKYYRIAKIITFWLSVLLTYVPLAVMVVAGFTGKCGSEKAVLIVCVLAAVILAIVESKTHHRIKGVFSLITLGCYLTVEGIGGYLLAIMICSVLDDILMDPLHCFYKEQFKKIDQAKAVKEYGC